MHRVFDYPAYWIGVVWLVWIVSWIAAAFWSARTAGRPGRGRELPYRIVTTVGAVLLAAGARHAYRTGFTVQAVGLALVVAGILFAWWARIHLGRMWSASVTRKDSHRIVQSGPYGLVRHPIYTGLLTAIIGTGLARGDVQGWIGAILIIAGCWAKARLEEGFLRAELGAADYDTYAARVPMLVPFLPR